MAISHDAWAEPACIEAVYLCVLQETATAFMPFWCGFQGA